jgi:hypothetical protein
MDTRQLVSDQLTGALSALLDVIGDGVALVNALSDNGVITQEMRAAHLVSSIRGDRGILSIGAHSTN